MDIVNGFSELPTDRIQQNTRDLRQCGLGFTNLGAAIMSQGLPYDSHEGRDFAASVTALLTGRAYRHSAKMAQKLGPFKHFQDNREKMLAVMARHLRHISTEGHMESDVWDYAWGEWQEAHAMGVKYGYRNSQATAMMPTGTVSFLLGADTTGVEPAFSLVTYKQLAAGGKMVMINQSAHLGARALGGYSEENILSMAAGDFSMVAEEDLPTFATAVGANSIRPMAHLEMVAAMQPFVSQAISKTVNLPHEATVEDIYEVYLRAHEMGVKALSVYRDGSKATQVLTANVKEEMIEKLVDDSGTLHIDVSTPMSWDSVVSDPVGDLKAVFGEDLGGKIAEPLITPRRRRLPRTRQSITHKIHVRSSLGEHEGYVTTGRYDDGTIGEFFVEGFGRSGGFTQNALAAWATSFSIAVQYGTPWEKLVRKHIGQSDETGGIVVPEKDGEPVPFRTCDSIVDYIAKWLVLTYGSVDLQEELGVMSEAVKARKATALDSTVNEEVVEVVADLEVVVSMNGHARSVEIGALTCLECHNPMQRTGTCWTCSKCGSSSGGCG